MKINSFRAATGALLALYVVAIFVTWLRKHTIDGDMLFWMAMSVLLLSGFDVANSKK